MNNPFRSWAKLVIKATPKKGLSADSDYEFLKQVAIARITGVLVLSAILLVYLILENLWPRFKHYWGTAFIIITMNLWCVVLWRFNRIAKFFAKKQNKGGES